jgi:ribonuclease Z
MDQAGTCIMVELGNGRRLFFDFGSGCMRNIIANQVPVPEINDIFITHLHVDHYADLPYLWAFAPFAARFKPLRVIGPSGRTPDLGTKAMCGTRKMGKWHMQAFSGIGPLESGFEIECTEFDFKRRWRRLLRQGRREGDSTGGGRMPWTGAAYRLD